jgi:hypothetical protein
VTRASRRSPSVSEPRLLIPIAFNSICARAESRSIASVKVVRACPDWRRMVATACVNYLNPASFVTVYTNTSFPLGTYGNTGKGAFNGSAVVGRVELLLPLAHHCFPEGPRRCPGQGGPPPSPRPRRTSFQSTTASDPLGCRLNPSSTTFIRSLRRRSGQALDPVDDDVGEGGLIAKPGR